jgi:hypothetical protein
LGASARDRRTKTREQSGQLGRQRALAAVPSEVRFGLSPSGLELSDQSAPIRCTNRNLTQPPVVVALGLNVNQDGILGFCFKRN